MHTEEKPRSAGEPTPLGASPPGRLAEVERLFEEATHEWHALAEALGSLRESLSPPDFQLALGHLELPDIGEVERQWREETRARDEEAARRRAASAAEAGTARTGRRSPSSAGDPGTALPAAATAGESARGSACCASGDAAEVADPDEPGAAAAEDRGVGSSPTAAKMTPEGTKAPRAGKKRLSRRQRRKRAAAAQKSAPTEKPPTAPLGDSSAATPAPDRTPSSSAGEPVTTAGGDDIQERLRELVTLLKEQIGRSASPSAAVPRELTLAIAREVAGRVRESVLEAMDKGPADDAGTPRPARRGAARIPIDDIAAMIDQVTGGGKVTP